ncbi:MAG: bifunctional phosphopantothenoylcysteine decarboxylase/phosphopantothenate--cysteine ligase CoaBC [Rikenellaceae bacterium]
MNILLCITGSIAAYKAAHLCRLFKVAGCDVKVIMTPLAKQFITPLTMATLSKNPILVEFFNPENGEWNSHVSLGEWADYMVIAPATANTMAKMAYGIADNLLLTTYLSARCQVVVAPAMDLDMYAHPATQQNIETLRGRGVHIVEPGSGELASGLVGKGRMSEPEEIFGAVEALAAKAKAKAESEADSKKKSNVEGKHFIVTAGATIEAIDPVRYITNHSTGKMGYAIAGALADRGARVTLISGRTALEAPKGVDRVDVVSAEEMYNASVEAFAKADGGVMCAAVADYTPRDVASQKLKKGDDDLRIELKRTRDIAAELGANKGSKVLVGFALETNDEQAHAQSKLKRKGFDFVVLNSLRDAGAGFGGDTNKVTFVSEGSNEELELMSKADVAQRIVDKIETLL